MARDPEPPRAEHQLGGHDAVEQEAALAVEVLEQRIQQAGPLHQPLFERRPLPPSDDDGHGIDSPWPARVGAVVVHDVTRALGLEQAVGPQAAFVDLGRPHAAERPDQRQPRLADVAALVGQLVVAPRLGGVGGESGREVHW